MSDPNNGEVQDVNFEESDKVVTFKDLVSLEIFQIRSLKNTWFAWQTKFLTIAN